MPTNYNPYLQTFQNQYPVYNSFAASPASVQPARPAVGGNVLGYQVDGEIGAKAFPFQNSGTEPIVLWDMNDSVFFLRSYNQSGFPNPLKRYRFVEEEIPQSLPAGMSGNAMAVNKNEVDELRQDVQRLTALVTQMQNQNNNQNQNQSASSGQTFNQNNSHNPGNGNSITQQNSGSGRGR